MQKYANGINDKEEKMFYRKLGKKQRHADVDRVKEELLKQAKTQKEKLAIYDAVKQKKKDIQDTQKALAELKAKKIEKALISQKEINKFTQTQKYKQMATQKKQKWELLKIQLKQALKDENSAKSKKIQKEMSQIINSKS